MQAALNKRDTDAGLITFVYKEISQGSVSPLCGSLAFSRIKSKIKYAAKVLTVSVLK